jgi:hypothetical protein
VLKYDSLVERCLHHRSLLFAVDSSTRRAWRFPPPSGFVNCYLLFYQVLHNVLIGCLFRFQSSELINLLLEWVFSSLRVSPFNLATCELVLALCCNLDSLGGWLPESGMSGSYLEVLLGPAPGTSAGRRVQLAAMVCPPSSSCEELWSRPSPPVMQRGPRLRPPH